MNGNMKTHVIRLTPGKEVKSCLEKYVEENVRNGCFVLSCCGSVTKATLRFAANKNGETNRIQTLENHYEVLAMNGSISPSGTHLHICLSDHEGATIGGHVMGDLIVFTTMEVMLGEPNCLQLTREMDSSTGFDELVVKPKNLEFNVI